MAPFSTSPILLDPSPIDDVFHFEPLKMELEAAFLEPLKLFPPEASSPLEQTRSTSTISFRPETETINPEPEYYTDEDVQTKWYSNEDLAQIKFSAKELSNELRRSTSPQDTTLTIAHRKTSLMLKSDFKALVKLSPTTPDQDLIQWCSYTDGRRGLERFASRDYAVLRRNDISNTRKAVLQSVKEGQDAETVAQLAREASRRARTFSRFFAAADADAAKKTIQETTRRLPARCVSLSPPGASTGVMAMTTSNTAPRRLPPLRNASTFSKTKLPPAMRQQRGVVSRCKSLRPSELAAPAQRCAPARKRSKQCHDGSDLLGLVR